jgi:hypothetical protein
MIKGRVDLHLLTEFAMNKKSSCILNSIFISAVGVLG